MRTCMIALVVVLALAGCVDPSTVGGDGSATEDEAPATETPEPTAAQAEHECIPTPEAAASIGDGLTVTGGGSLRDAVAVALPASSESGVGFVVAAEIDGPGMEGDGEVGTWAVGELAGGPTIAANTIAQEFSEWGACRERGLADGFGSGCSGELG